MATHVLVTASLGLKGGRPDRIHHYRGVWYSEEDTRAPLETMTGSLAEVTAWARGKGTDVEFQLPSSAVLEANRRQREADDPEG